MNENDNLKSYLDMLLVAAVTGGEVHFSADESNELAELITEQGQVVEMLEEELADFGLRMDEHFNKIYGALNPGHHDEWQSPEDVVDGAVHFIRNHS